MARVLSRRSAGRPPIRTRPCVGRSTPSSSCSSVLLPQPLAPMTDTNSPSWMWQLTLSRTSLDPYQKVRPDTVTRGLSPRTSRRSSVIAAIRATYPRLPALRQVLVGVDVINLHRPVHHAVLHRHVDPRLQAVGVDGTVLGVDVGHLLVALPRHLRGHVLGLDEDLDRLLRVLRAPAGALDQRGEERPHQVGLFLQ